MDTIRATDSCVVSVRGEALGRPRRFTVVTPCFNAAPLAKITALSILSQSAVREGRADLEYLVCDGGSTDGTVDAVREVCGDRAVVISEPDRGMYHALAKGLRRATGDVVSYLNAGDIYSPTAFDVVAEVMEAKRTSWLTGLRVTCNDRLQVVEVLLPYPYRRRLLRRGLYGMVLPFVQQESTFWRRELHQLIDFEKLATLQYAGDFYLWRCFARITELVLVEAYLGGFTYHRGQRSENRRAYLQELRALREPPTPFDWLSAHLDRKLWALPAPMKKRLHPEGIVRYNLREAKWD